MTDVTAVRPTAAITPSTQLRWIDLFGSAWVMARAFTPAAASRRASRAKNLTWASVTVVAQFLYLAVMRAHGGIFGSRHCLAVMWFARERLRAVGVIAAATGMTVLFGLLALAAVNGGTVVSATAIVVLSVVAVSCVTLFSWSVFRQILDRRAVGFSRAELRRLSAESRWARSAQFAGSGDHRAMRRLIVDTLAFADQTGFGILTVAANDKLARQYRWLGFEPLPGQPRVMIRRATNEDLSLPVAADKDGFETSCLELGLRTLLAELRTGEASPERVWAELDRMAAAFGSEPGELVSCASGR